MNTKFQHIIMVLSIASSAMGCETGGASQPVCQTGCDDGDPCTADECTPDGCTHALATHDVECPSGNGIGHGYCEPKTGQCCVGYDVGCCYGCLVTETIDGVTMDVCLDVCPGTLACDPTDGRCH